jgi:hypothetical protein
MALSNTEMTEIGGLLTSRPPISLRAIQLT